MSACQCDKEAAALRRRTKEALRLNYQAQTLQSRHHLRQFGSEPASASTGSLSLPSTPGGEAGAPAVAAGAGVTPSHQTTCQTGLIVAAAGGGGR